jgi:hypothetical protein
MYHRNFMNPPKEFLLIVIGLLVVAFLATTDDIPRDVSDSVVDSVYPTVDERAVPVASTLYVRRWFPTVVAVASKQGSKFFDAQAAFHPLGFCVVSVPSNDIQHAGFPPPLVLRLKPVNLGAAATDDASISQLGCLDDLLVAARTSAVPVSTSIPSSDIGQDCQPTESHACKVDVLGASATFLLPECGRLEGALCPTVAATYPSFSAVPCFFDSYDLQFSVLSFHSSLFIG